MPYVHPQDRVAAATLILDAVASMNWADYGTKAADDRLLLALDAIGPEFAESPALFAVVSAAVDLVTFMAVQEGHRGGATHKMVANNFKRSALPQIYPDAFWPGPVAIGQAATAR